MSRAKPRKARKAVLVLTGPSAAGKSTLALALRRRGWRLIDGDLEAKRLYAPGSPAWKPLQRFFGEGIFRCGGRVDRAALARRIFSSLRERRRLTRIVYPLLVRRIRRRLRGRPPACADMAVYFDAGAPDLGARVVLVLAPLKVRLRRLRAHGLPRARALAQARALRFGPGEKRRADLVIHNRGSKSALLHRFFRWLATQG